MCCAQLFGRKVVPKESHERAGQRQIFASRLVQLAHVHRLDVRTAGGFYVHVVRRQHDGRISFGDVCGIGDVVDLEMRQAIAHQDGVSQPFEDWGPFGFDDLFGEASFAKPVEKLKLRIRSLEQKERGRSVLVVGFHDTQDDEEHPGFDVLPAS